MPDKLTKVLVIGSGPIIIGQAAEFDYAGTQACKALREEGITTVLVNSNPATIMTDEGIADIIYIEPLTVDVLSRIIERERPEGQGLLPDATDRRPRERDREGLRRQPLTSPALVHGRRLRATDVTRQPAGSHTAPLTSICALVRKVFRFSHDLGMNCGMVPSSRTFVTW